MQLMQQIEAAEFAIRALEEQQPMNEELIRQTKDKMEKLKAVLCHRTGMETPEGWKKWFARPVFKPQKKYAELFTRTYECKEYTCMGHPRGCLFCKHLSDVFWDYLNGPYMFFCDLADDCFDGVFGRCKLFDESGEADAKKG